MLTHLENLGKIGSRWACACWGKVDKFLVDIECVKMYTNDILLLSKEGFPEHIYQLIVIFYRLCILGLLILILECSPCTEDVHIVGSLCYTPCTEAKKTLDSVPIWLILLRFSLPLVQPKSLPILFSSVTLPSNSCPPPPLPLPSTFLLPDQSMPAPTTVSPLVPLFSSLRLTYFQMQSHSNVLRDYVLISLYILPHQLKPRLRPCRTPTSRLPAAAGSALSIAAPPIPGTPSEPDPFGGEPPMSLY